MQESALTPAPISAPTAIDARLFRDTLGHYASGITVISGLEADEPVGFTCQSFYSVSVDPPLVSFSVMLTSTTYPRAAALFQGLVPASARGRPARELNASPVGTAPRVRAAVPTD
jgi:hypothetical protein